MTERVRAAAWIDNTRHAGGHSVIGCAALARRHRDVPIGDRAAVRLVYLKGDETLIARPIAIRHEVFMPSNLLHSEFEALEEPGFAENSPIASIAPPPSKIVAAILSALSMAETTPPEMASLRPSGVAT
jgi:gluconokinase